MFNVQTAYEAVQHVDSGLNLMYGNDPCWKGLQRQAFFSSNRWHICILCAIKYAANGWVRFPAEMGFCCTLAIKKCCHTSYISALLAYTDLFPPLLHPVSLRRDALFSFCQSFVTFNKKTLDMLKHSYSVSCTYSEWLCQGKGNDVLVMMFRVVSLSVWIECDERMIWCHKVIQQL